MAGCYQPAFPTGGACAVDSDCPANQPCVDNVCGGISKQSDAPLPDSSVTVDAPEMPLDGAPPVMVTIGDTASDVADTELNQAASTPQGAFDHMSVDDNETTLIRFNLSSISSSATVISAKLIVRTFDQASTDGGTVLVHRMRQSWSEASATWAMRNGNSAWTTAGALPPSRDAAPIATIQPLSINTDYEVDLPIGMVQDWVSTPMFNNFGIAIVRGTSTEHVHLRSRENTPNSRLSLVIQ